MSTSSIHIDSFRHTQERYAHTARQVVDPLRPPIHSTFIAPVYPLKRELGPDNTATLGTTTIFKTPVSGYIHSIALKVQFGTTTTADMSNYPLFAAIERIEIVIDSEIIMQYYYRPVVQYYLSKLNDEEAVDRVLDACGGTNCGTSSAAINTLAPIPTFFDPICCPGSAPLNLSMFTRQPEIRVTFRAAADVVKATGGGADIVSAVMVYYMSEASPSLKNAHMSDPRHHKSIDFNTIVNTTLTTAISNSVDVSGIKGQIKRLFLILSLSATVAANTYFVNTEIDSCKLDLDGNEEWMFRTKEEGQYDYMIYSNGRAYNSTIGYPYILPYSQHTQERYAVHNVSGIHSSRVNRHLLKVVHSAGADSSLDVLGIRSAIYVYRGGGMQRYL